MSGYCSENAHVEILFLHDTVDEQSLQSLVIRDACAHQVFKVGGVDDKRSKAFLLDTLKSSFLQQQGNKKVDDSSKKE